MPSCHVTPIKNIHVNSNSIWKWIQHFKHLSYGRMWYDLCFRAKLSSWLTPRITCRPASSLESRFNKSLRYCLNATFTSNLSRRTIYWNVIISLRTSRHDVITYLIVASWIGPLIWHRWHWHPFFSRSLIPFLPRGNQTRLAHHMTFLLLEEDTNAYCNSKPINLFGGSTWTLS